MTIMTPAPANRHSCRAAFSLIEVIVVIGLLGILIGLLLQATQSVRLAAVRLQCQNHEKQIALALHHYESVHHGFPLSRYIERIPGISNRSAVYNWYLLLTPFLEQEQIYREAQLAMPSGQSWETQAHLNVITVLKVYTCPADPRLSAPLEDELGFRFAGTSYVGSFGSGQVPPNDPQYQQRHSDKGVFAIASGKNLGCKMSQITDGLSSTLLFGESPPVGRIFAGSWYAGDIPPQYLWHVFPWRQSLTLVARYVDPPQCPGIYEFSPGRLSNTCDSYKYWSLHPGGANFAFADGSVRFLRYSVSQEQMRAIATVSGGEVVSLD